MSATELTGAAIVAQHLADVRTAAEPEQETLGRFAGKVKSDEPKLNGSELPLLLALLVIAENKFKAQRPEIEKAIERGIAVVKDDATAPRATSARRGPRARCSSTPPPRPTSTSPDSSRSRRRRR